MAARMETKSVCFVSFGLLLAYVVFSFLSPFDADAGLNPIAEFEIRPDKQSISRVPDQRRKGQEVVVHGSVTHFKTNRPIAGAVVLLEKKSDPLKCITDEKGRFEFSCKRELDLPVTLKALAEGFESSSHSLTELPTKFMEIQLVPEKRGRFIQVSIDPQAEPGSGRCVVYIHRVGARKYDTSAIKLQVFDFSDFPVTIESPFEECDIFLDLPNYLTDSVKGVDVPISQFSNPGTTVSFLPDRGAEVFGWFLSTNQKVQHHSLRVLARHIPGCYEPTENLRLLTWSKDDLDRTLRTKIASTAVHSDGPVSFRIRGLAPGEYEVSAVADNASSLSLSSRIKIVGREIVGPIKLGFPLGGPLSIEFSGDVAKFIETVELYPRMNTKKVRSSGTTAAPRSYVANVIGGRANFPHVEIGEYKVNVLPPAFPKGRMEKMPQSVYSYLSGFCGSVFSQLWIDSNIKVDGTDPVLKSINLDQILELHDRWQTRIGVEEIKREIRHGFEKDKLGMLRRSETVGLTTLEPKELEARFLAIERRISLLINRDIPWIRRNIKNRSAENDAMMSRIEELAGSLKLENIILEILGK